MKPKEYVKKYNLEVSDQFNHNEFILDFTNDFMTTIEYLQAAKQLNYARFETVVKEIRQKWDGISNKTKGQLPDKLWNYFYATVVVKVRDQIFGEYLRKEKERKQKEWKQRNAWKGAYYGGSEYLNDGETFKFNFSYESDFINLLYGLLFGRSQTIQFPYEAFGILDLPADSTIEAINSKYRQMSLQCHPDKGGSKDDFVRLTEAKNKCIMYATQKGSFANA